MPADQLTANERRIHLYLGQEDVVMLNLPRQADGQEILFSPDIAGASTSVIGGQVYEIGFQLQFAIPGTNHADRAIAQLVFGEQ
jgi:hypothetical protein